MPYPYPTNSYQSKKINTRASVKAGKPFWVAFSILLILLIITGALLLLRLYDYSQVDHRELSLKSNMDEELDVFSITYHNASGEITVNGTDGAKVIAPGTAVEYTVRLRNTDKVAIDYTLMPKLEFLSEHKIPIEVRLLDTEGNYLVGDAKTWVMIEELNGIEEKATLAKGKTMEYIFQWRWPFDVGNDEYDTTLGNTVINTNIGVDLGFTVHSEANTVIKDNGGFVESGTGDIVLAVIFVILLAAAIILLIVTVTKKHIQKQQAKATVAASASKKLDVPTPKPSNLQEMLKNVSRIDIEIRSEDHKK